MPNAPFVALGLDFGTESVRALLVDGMGTELSSAVAPYKHGQIIEKLPTSGSRLPPLYALQNPKDWMESSAAAARCDSEGKVKSERCRKYWRRFHQLYDVAHTRRWHAALCA